MPRANTKEVLLKDAKANFAALFALIDSMPENLQNAPLPYNKRDTHLKDVLVHLYEWQELLLKFLENIQRSEDFKPFLPAPYNFRTYPLMNENLRLKHQDTSLKEAKRLLKESFENVLKAFNTLPREGLFEKKYYAFCGNSSLGSYCVSSTASHYLWAIKCIKSALKSKS